MKLSTSVISSIACLLASASAFSVCSDTTVTTYATTYIPYETTTTSSNTPSSTSTEASSTSTEATSSTSSTEASSTTSTTPTTSSTSTSSSTTSTTPTTSSTSTSSSTTSTTPTTSSTSTSSSTTSTTSTTTSTTSSKAATATSSTVTTTSSSLTSSSTTTTSSSSTSTATTFDFASVYLAKHNYFRELMQDTDDVTWSDSIAEVAQGYADDYTCDGTLVHSGNYLGDNELGENLAYGYTFETAGAVTAWFNEISEYDYNNPGFSESTGHFTQLVWSATTEIGCAYKYCGTYYGYYVVCNYLPEGNIDLVGDTSYFYKLYVKEPKDDSTLAGGFTQD